MASKKDIFLLKLAIEQDSKLSHGAARLGFRICSYVYNHPQLRFVPDEDFPLPWTEASRICFGMSKREIYRLHRELHDCGYVLHCGVKGCPGKAHYRLVLANCRGAKNGTPSSAKNGTPSRAKCDTPRGAKCDASSSAKIGTPRGAMKRSPHISNLPSEEMVKTKEENSSLRSTVTKGENNGSLRSKETRGKELAVPPADQMTDAERTRYVHGLRKLKSQIKA